MNSDSVRRAGLLLRVLRLKAGLEQEELGRMLGVSQATISRYEHGRLAPEAELARRWAEVCGAAAAGQTLERSYAAQDAAAAVPERLQAQAQVEAELWRQVQQSGQPGAVAAALAQAYDTRVPYFADVAAGVGEAQEVRTAPRGYIPVPAELLARDPECYALCVRGDSMAPVLVDGDIVVVSPAAQLLDGCIVAAFVDPDGDVVKEYYALPGGGALLKPVNPAYPAVHLGPERGRDGRIWGRVILQLREL